MAFNPLENFLQGQQLGRQINIADLQSALSGQINQPGFNPGESQQLQQLSALDPALGQQVLSTFTNLDDTRKKSFFEDARKGRKLLEAGDTDKFLTLATNRVNQTVNRNGDPSDSLAVLNSVQNGDIQGAINQLSQVEGQGIELNFLSDPLEREVKKAKLETKGKKVTTAAMANFLFREQLIDQGRLEEAEAFANSSGLSRLSPEEAADLEAVKAFKKESEKKRAITLSGFMNSGVEAADGVGNLTRAVSLLDSVETGGIDRLSQFAKNTFGIESADEGELSNLMGKAVLQQLKPIFGAAFTANEGQALRDIEASFTRSPATNKRLLTNALKIATRGAKRGRRAAKELGNDFLVDEIDLALDFKLNEPPKSKPEQPAGANQVGRFTVEAL